VPHPVKPIILDKSSIIITTNNYFITDSNYNNYKKEPLSQRYKQINPFEDYVEGGVSKKLDKMKTKDEDNQISNIN